MSRRNAADMRDDEVDEEEWFINKSLSVQSNSNAAEIAIRPSPSFHTSALFAEFLGCFLLVFLFLCLFHVSSILESNAVTVPRLLYLSLGYGMLYSCLLYSLSLDAPNDDEQPSIRHLNPAVTLTLAFMRKIPVNRTIVILVIQILATLLANGFALLVLPEKWKRQNYEQLDEVTALQTISSALICGYTFLLIFTSTNFAQTTQMIQQQLVGDMSEQQPQTVHELNCTLVGFTVFVLTIASSPVTGGFLNAIVDFSLLGLTKNISVGSIVGPILTPPICAFSSVIFNYIRIRRPFSSLTASSAAAQPNQRSNNRNFVM